ncbi:hypothetical protein ILUMI_11300 [Ignelater luminosus]|uniref:PiggyBac transposable element-derived protein domain-containing protein n=1 Tax=Ignelater luminosus TaxID=2038154 RepID=A0A8K0CYP6_IGNLU|nr:hypothetical protein ILUMI_11300 [Ignelater luminosus]
MRVFLQRSRDCSPTNLMAFIGLFYIVGFKKVQHLNIAELWSSDGTAIDCFQVTDVLQITWQYMTSKREKHAIAKYAHVGARTFYVHNMELYSGQQPEGPFKLPHDATSVIKRLIKTIDESGKNVTMDNYFTSIFLTNDFYTNYKLTMVRKNKPRIPPEFLQVKEPPL